MTFVIPHEKEKLLKVNNTFAYAPLFLTTVIKKSTQIVLRNSQNFFGELQEREKEFGIADIQLGLTTLEEVFLNIAKQAELESAAADGTFATLVLNSGASLQVRYNHINPCTPYATIHAQLVTKHYMLFQNVQIPIGARFIGIPGTESAENPRGIMVQVYWQQDDSGALCISGYSEEMPIPSHVQFETPPPTNVSGRRKLVRGIVIDPSQITDSDSRS